MVKITLRGERAKIEGRGAAVEKGVLVIHEGGSYRLEGESRIPIEVRAANVSVLLYLNGVKIHTRGKNAIRAVQRGELGLIFEGEKANEIVTDGRTDKKGEALEPDNIRAAVYSKGNLYLAGSGSAVITAADQGFVAKEELLVTEGAYDIETEDDIFRGKESVDLQGGVVRASARGEKGKGVSSDGAVTLAGGSYVFAYTSEGIEGKTIEMSGGSFDISADDDGMNAREHYDSLGSYLGRRTPRDRGRRRHRLERRFDFQRRYEFCERLGQRQGRSARLERQLPRGRRGPDCLGHEGAGGEDFGRFRAALLRVGAE